MASALRPPTPDDVVGKVLRRAEVAKMARKLQNRLALASYKTQHGQEGLCFNDVEARLERTMQRQRPSSSVDTSSTSSSSSSEHRFFSGGPASSPLTAPFPSDDVRNSGTRSSHKRDIYRSTTIDSGANPSKRIRSHPMAPPMFESARASWTTSHDPLEPSPGLHRPGSRFSNSRGPNLSLASEVSTKSGSPFGHISDNDEDDDDDVDDDNEVSNSFAMQSSFRSSPPRTPPPTRSRASRHRKAAGEEGADLLLYLATSPSPANPGMRSSQIYAPSTPPSNAQALPSSMMNTPSMTGFTTPGQNFNFADFVNVTPSPAQGAFGNRTPGLPRTPLAAREARRRLNFDTLAPPAESPKTTSIGRGSTSTDSGLGMELGGQLVS